MIDLHLFLGRPLRNTVPEGQEYDPKEVGNTRAGFSVFRFWFVRAYLFEILWSI
mgnify:CR=1 FL=1